MAAAGGGPRCSAPPSPAFVSPAAVLTPGEGFARQRPARKVPRFPLRPAQPLIPVGPAAPAPAPPPSGPAAAPITSATGPAPTFGDPGRGLAGRGAGRRGPGSGARPPPALASAATACPLPARAGAPARPPPPLPGEEGGMEPPLPPPLPPRSPAEGREGSAPRQDPPLRPPPATSTPSLAPSPAPRALPLNGSESAKEGETGKYPPARVGGGAEPPPPRGTVPGAASRWRCGRGRAQSGVGVCTPVAQAQPARASPARERGQWGLAGNDGGPRTLVSLPLPLCLRALAQVWGNNPPRAARGPLRRLSKPGQSSQN